MHQPPTIYFKGGWPCPRVKLLTGIYVFPLFVSTCLRLSVVCLFLCLFFLLLIRCLHCLRCLRMVPVSDCGSSYDIHLCQRQTKGSKYFVCSSIRTKLVACAPISLFLSPPNEEATTQIKYFKFLFLTTSVFFFASVKDGSAASSIMRLSHILYCCPYQCCLFISYSCYYYH